MAKAKKKRTAKDLEKLWRTGKYWEWVQLISQTNQINLYQAQWQEAWRYLCRQALRQPGQLEEFWPRLEEQPQAPNLPDLVFIRGLKDFFTGRAALPDIAALSGLSPAAQMLRGKLVSWSHDARQDQKISRLLNRLTQQPDQVSGKTFTDLAALVKPNPLAASLISLGKTINQIRKLNHKGGFNPHLVGMGRNELKRADNLLSRLAPTWNPTVRAALLHPFCHQLSKCLQGLWIREDFDKIVYLTSFLPFLCSQTFGPDADQLQAHSRRQSENFFSEAEQGAFLEQSWSQGLEAQALALGKVRRVFKSEKLYPSDLVLAKFRTTYLRFLNEIGRLQADMTPREKIDLMRFLDPILFQDRHWLEDDETFLWDFLRQAFASGAAGVRLSILVLLSPDLAIHPTLRRQARENLQKLPYPGDPIIEEISADPKLIPLPEIHLLKPLFELYPNAAGMRQIIVDHAITGLNILLLTSAINLQYEKGKQTQKEMLHVFRHGMQIFTASLAELQEFPEIRPLQDLAVCFPEGYYTPEGYQRLLQRLYDRSHSLDQLLSQISQYVNIADLADLIDSPLIHLFSSRWIEIHETLLWQFMNDHRADLETASLDALWQLVDMVCSQDEVEPPAANFLLHLANLLQRRLQAGETDAEPLYDQILSTLISIRQSGSTRRLRK